MSKTDDVDVCANMAAPDVLTPLVEDNIDSNGQQNSETVPKDEVEDTESEWGFPLAELFPLALTFFKGTR